MIALLMAGGLSLAVSLVGTRFLIEWLRRVGIGQPIREEGPEGHHTKAGTPTMGGIAIVAGAVAGYAVAHLRSRVVFTRTGILVLALVVGAICIAAAVLMMQVYIDTHPQLFPTGAERADLRLLFLCIILGVTSWTGLCRLLRGETLKIRELDYIQAAQAFGVSHLRIILRHMVPNVMAPYLIMITAFVGQAILLEASLSFLGAGVPPDVPTWGSMVSAGQPRLQQAWWACVFPGVFLFMTVLAINLIGDGLRDALDPRARKR